MNVLIRILLLYISRQLELYSQMLCTLSFLLQEDITEMNPAVAHSERLRPFRVIIKASERICESDMKFRVAMPRSAHARRTHHVTNIHVYVWK